MTEQTYRTPTLHTSYRIGVYELEVSGDEHVVAQDLQGYLDELTEVIGRIPAVERVTIQRQHTRAPQPLDAQLPLPDVSTIAVDLEATPSSTDLPTNSRAWWLIASFLAVVSLLWLLVGQQTGVWYQTLAFLLPLVTLIAVLYPLMVGRANRELFR